MENYTTDRRELAYLSIALLQIWCLGLINIYRVVYIYKILSLISRKKFYSAGS
jgi:hypothetical protein